VKARYVNQAKIRSLALRVPIIISKGAVDTTILARKDWKELYLYILRIRKLKIGKVEDMSRVGRKNESSLIPNNLKNSQFIPHIVNLK